MSENILQFVAAASNGDTDAMGKLYSRSLKASYFLATTLCGNKQEATEIVKKAYARAFCNIDKLKKAEAFEIWMKQNVATAYKESHKFVFSDADGAAVENSAEFLPESVLTDDELADKVISAVTSLRPELKTALILYYNNGMPVQVLAKFLGVSDSTANALVGKARSTVLSAVGIEAVSESVEGALPVITRLLQKKTAEVEIGNADVRSIFTFAIEAYIDSRPSQPVVEESQENAENIEDKENDEELNTEEIEEVVSDEADEEVSDEDADSDEEESTDEEITEDSESEDEDTESDDESEKAEETKSTDDDQNKDIEKAIVFDEEIPDNILSFKQRISDILDDRSDEETEVLPDVEDTILADIPEDEENDLTQVPDLKLSFEESDAAVADFGGISIDDSENEIAVQEVSAPAKSGKKTDPKKIIIAVVVALAIIALAVFGISKLAGGNGANTGVTEEETAYTWVAGGFSDCVELGYLDDESAYFKSATTGKYGLIDYQGNVILQPNYEGFVRCSNGREYDKSDSYHSLVIIGNERFEFNIANGTVIISENPHLSHSIPTTTLEDTAYDERDRYFEGYAAARKNEKWGYVSEDKDKKVIPYEYEAVNELADGETSACDYCRPVSNGLIPVKKDGKMGIINLKNDEVVPFEYSNIMPGSEGIFIACKDGIWGVIVTGEAQKTFKGVNFVVEVIPPEVSDVEDDNTLGKYKVSSEDGANVRADAGSDYDLVGELDTGDVVIGYETKKAENGNKWLKIKINGEYGWVALNMLEPAE